MLEAFKFQSVAPTNKACRIIDGKTIHRFIATFNLAKFKQSKVEYLFIDEVSMMCEMFYRFFITIKRSLPNLKYIIAGDFEQLLPVRDRVEDCDYKNSIALHELSDGNRLQLSRCRRSDDVLFNMLLPNNIEKIQKQDFNNVMTDAHICFTNKKRIEINKFMMDEATCDKDYIMLERRRYDKNSQNVKLMIGTPLIARMNNKKENIFNNEIFEITNIDKKKNIFTVVGDEMNDVKIKFHDVTKFFNVAYCITCHKSQGTTIKTSYTIHEFNKMDKRLKYVALSRASDINFINIL